MEKIKHTIYQTLYEQYQHFDVPLHLFDDRIEFSIFNLKDLQRPLPFKFPASRLNFFVFNFVKNAYGSYAIDDHTFPLQPRTIYFTSPGHFRSFEYTSLEEIYLITLSENFLKENVHPAIYDEFSFLLTETLPPTVVSEEVFYEFECIYQMIHKEYMANSPNRMRLIGSLFVVLLLKFKDYFWLNTNIGDEVNRSAEIVKIFKRHLEKHYCDLAAGIPQQVFRVQDYADAQHLHPNYLNNVIKNKTGKSVGTWIAEKTMGQAKSMLQNSSVSIKEISSRLGFTKPAYFNNYFKKHLHTSPGTYRKAHAIAKS